MPRFLSILTHRWVLAVIPALLSILLMPELFSPFTIRQISSDYIPGGVKIAWADMDGDGQSEWLQAGNFIHQTTFLVLKDLDKRFINEWNFPGHLLSLEFPFLTGDYDNNGYLEVYLATHKKDSLFINCCEPLNRDNPGIRSRFLALSLPGLSQYDFIFQPAGLSDLDADGTQEVVFLVAAGFCKQPRNVFAWNIRKDSILVSPFSAAQIREPQFADLNRDGRDEIIVNCYAPGNCSYGEYPYGDSSAWLMVMDQNLQFLFEPREYKGRTGLLTVVPFEENKQSVLMLKYNLYASGELHHRIEKAGSDGVITETRQLPYSHSQVSRMLRFENQDGMGLFMLYHNTSKLIELNSSLDTLRLLETGEPSAESEFAVYDLDADGNNELLIRTGDGRTLRVFDRDLRHTTSFGLPFNTRYPFFSTRIAAHNNIHFVFQDGDNLLEFHYAKNPLTWFRIPFYLAIYLAWMFLIGLIQYLGRVQIQRQIRIKNRISELQTLVLQNQLDPHFILNAVSSVNASLSLGLHEEAGEKMGHFSRLIRSSLMDAGKTHRSLQEELDFVKAFLEVERSRMEYPFDYQIDIEDDIDMQTEIPKMLIQTFAENSVKHGLKPLKHSGLLSIQIRRDMQKRDMLILLEDNGIGRQKAGSLSTGGSGKGLDIIRQLIDLHNSLSGKTITWQITDIADEAQIKSGTRTAIRLGV